MSTSKKSKETISSLIRKTIDKERFVKAMLQLAYDGDLGAMKLVMQYHDGVPAALPPEKDDEVNRVVFVLPSNNRDSAPLELEDGSSP